MAQLRRVGDLARRARVSVRTLRYYDEIGLLAPSHHSEAGYRLYADPEIARLQQIKSLRELGFSLHEIRAILNEADVSPERIIRLHIGRLKEMIKLQQGLCGRLEAIADRLSSSEEISSEEFIQTMELMSMIDKTEKYYTPEQRAVLKDRATGVGEERIREVEAEWPQLMEQVRAEMEQGTDPGSEQVQALARRWRSLVEEFTGGDPGIERSLRTMYENEPDVMDRSGVDPRMFAYIGKALEIARRED